MVILSVPRFLLSCSFDHHRPKRNVWRSKSGIRIASRKKYGVPYGRARAILLCLVQMAAVSGRRIRGSLRDIRDILGVDWSLDILEKHLQRIIHSRYDRVLACSCSMPNCNRAEMLEVIKARHYCARTRTFDFEIGGELLGSEGKGIPCRKDVVMALIQAEQFQALDLYIWCEWRIASADRSAIDPFGPDGPFGVAPFVADVDRQRSRLDEVYRTLIRFWPECPFQVEPCQSANKRKLVYAPEGRKQTLVESARRTIRNVIGSARKSRQSRQPRPLPRPARVLGPPRAAFSLLPQLQSIEDLRRGVDMLRDQLRGRLDDLTKSTSVVTPQTTRGPPR